ncbi:MAG: hypothetical protein IKY44_03475 [Clostridia bacterium]|nr:hypothetical protein [Clostridia bacterium]
MNVSFSGFNEKSATFNCAQDVEAGKAVKVSANGTVSACKNGDVFCGVATSVRGECAAVQLAGYIRMPYSGSAPALGYTALAANGNGGVAVNEGGRSCLVTDVDTTDGTVGFML